MTLDISAARALAADWQETGKVRLVAALDETLDLVDVLRSENAEVKALLRAEFDESCDRLERLMDATAERDVLQGRVTELEAFLAAVRARREVCQRDCEWPRGDGPCGYCASERDALNALLAAENA